MAIMDAMKGSAAPGRAIALAVAGGALLTISDAGLKYLAQELPPGQIMFIRGIIAGFALVMATLGTRGAKALMPQKWRLHIARGSPCTASHAPHHTTREGNGSGSYWVQLRTSGPSK